MEILDVPGWRYFIDEKTFMDLRGLKTGKWMYFYKSPEEREFTAQRCQDAVEKCIVAEAKVSDHPVEGASCFYLKIDDMEGHKRVIQYFLDNNMIRRTKAGRLYNISFKLDSQTRAGEYGKDFQAELKLEQLMDLNTGAWLV